MASGISGAMCNKKKKTLGSLVFLPDSRKNTMIFLKPLMKQLLSKEIIHETKILKQAQFLNYFFIIRI
jgi:hypothetical protein